MLDNLNILEYNDDMKKYLSLLIATMFITPVLSQEVVYKCQDKTTGGITYRNSPCTRLDKQVSTTTVPTSVTDSDNLPPYVQGKPQGYWQSRIGRIDPLVDDYVSPPMPKIVVPVLPANDSDKVYNYRQ